MRYILLACLIITVSTIVPAQNQTEDIDSITTTVRNYFEGYVERNIDKLNKAFDIENGTMKVPVNDKDAIIGYKNLYFKDLMPKWGNREKLPEAVLNNCELDILSIEVFDSGMATARINMKVDTFTYVDILSLQRIMGQWKITNKMYLSYEN